MKKLLAMVLLYTSLSSAVSVGVIGLTVACPDLNVRGIFLDAEDHNNISGLVDGGETVPQGVNFAEGRVNFYYCRINSSHLRAVPYDYAVLRLDNECPAGAYPFRRHHDTEDKNNNNGTVGDIRPSVIGKDADIEYCFFPGTPGATGDFPVALHGRFAVLARHSSDTLLYAQIRVDDEDTKNANSWYWYGQDNNTNLINRIKRIVEDRGGKDTYYNFTWKDPFLFKVGEYATPDIAGAAAGMPAELKGFDHSAVTFETKSVGKAVVSILNVNGSVVARVETAYLMPGIHHVEWNSGAVPNGRYLVTIEHNGKISGKNVILK